MSKIRVFECTFKKIFIAGLILLLQLVHLNTVLANRSGETEEAEIIEETQENEEVQEKVPVDKSDHKNEMFLLQIRQQLQNARIEYSQVGSNISDAKEKLVQVTETITSLKEQLKNFDYLISNTQAKIRNVEKQIAQKENQIEVLEEDIHMKEIELENQKMLLKEYLKLLYLQENSFYDNRENQNISVSKLLLADNSVGDTFQEIQYFTILEQTGQNIFNRIDKIKNELEAKQDKLEETKQKLSRLKFQLIEEKKSLKLQRNAKNKLLEQTKGEEEIYRELIAQSKREQLLLVEEINALKENLLFIEKKIEEEGENFDPDNYKNLINPNVRAIYDFEISGEYATGEKLNWPVNPSRGISAYYKDPSYKATFGIPHNAIDIPVPQGSPIRAPAAGVVYKAHDNGDESYSYLIIAHKGGTLTVYGHVTEILVNERDIVLPGEIIALSGGIPGTKGSGYLTTGAHLHFEVIQGGKHINPLLALPLDKLPEEYIPAYFKDDSEDNEESTEEVPTEDV